MRRVVYETVAARRREINGQSTFEPGDDWLGRVWERDPGAAVPRDAFRPSALTG